MRNLSPRQIGQLKQEMESAVRAKLGKSCKTGKPCGGSCISKKYQCRQGGSAVKGLKFNNNSSGDFIRAAEGKYKTYFTRLDNIDKAEEKILLRKEKALQAYAKNPSKANEAKIIKLALSSKTQETEAKRLEVFTEMKMALLSRVSVADADKWYKGLGLDKDADTPVIKSTLIEGYRLSNGKITTLKDVLKSDPRAYASKDGQLINIGDGRRSTVLHELGHHVEYGRDRYVNASKDFILSRATTKNTEKLSDITGSKFFRDDEIAYRGNFIHPYVGKKNISGYTEVVAMGVERFVNAPEMLSFYQADKEHFKYILGILGE